MSKASDALKRYGHIPWLRRKAINDLRAEHMALWTFRPGQVVVRPWCFLCGSHDHYGVIESLRRDPLAVHAKVHHACRGGEVHYVNTIFLKHPLPPHPQAVLDLRAVVKRK